MDYIEPPNPYPAIILGPLPAPKRPYHLHLSHKLNAQRFTLPMSCCSAVNHWVRAWNCGTHAEAWVRFEMERLAVVLSASYLAGQSWYAAVVPGGDLVYRAIKQAAFVQSARYWLIHRDTRYDAVDQVATIDCRYVLTTHPLVTGGVMWQPLTEREALAFALRSMALPVVDCCEGRRHRALNTSRGLFPRPVPRVTSGQYVVMLGGKEVGAISYYRVCDEFGITTPMGKPFPDDVVAIKPLSRMNDVAQEILRQRSLHLYPDGWNTFKAENSDEPEG